MKLRPFRPGDESPLVALYARAFGRVIDEAHLRWKLLSHAFPGDSVFVAEEDGAPIGMYAGVPLRVQGGAWAILSVDTMTDPARRRRGLLTAMATHAYAEWKARGATHVFGIPNEAWGSRAPALGWRPWQPLRNLVRPLDVEALAARRLVPIPGKLASRLHARAWQAVAPRDDSVEVARASSPEALEDFRAGEWLVKDAGWVAWRFFSCPSARYGMLVARRGGEVLGYAAVRAMRGGIAQLAELVAPDRGAEHALLRASVSHAESLGAEKLQALAVEHTHQSRALQRAGFWLPRERFQSQSVPLTAPSLPPACPLAAADFDL